LLPEPLAVSWPRKNARRSSIRSALAIMLAAALVNEFTCVCKFSRIAAELLPALTWPLKKARL